MTVDPVLHEATAYDDSLLEGLYSGALMPYGANVAAHLHRSC
jgi:hypothetical protein